MQATDIGVQWPGWCHRRRRRQGHGPVRGNAALATPQVAPTKKSATEPTRPAGLPGWLQFSWSQTDDLISGRDLNVTQIGADFRKIASEFACVLHPVLSNILNDRVFHLSTSNSSSGEQISGHSNPSPSTICLTFLRVKGLFRWAKFQVMMTSIPLTAATAI
jgi:hypothetical protein